MQKGKIALVTGGSSGIGFEVAVALGSQGVRVAVVASSSAAKARACVDRIAANGGNAMPFVANVSNVGEVMALVHQVEVDMGHIDFLVNSAGVYYPTPVGMTSEKEFDRMVSINLKGSFFAINAVASGMRERRAGRIVNVASVAGIVGSPNYSLYAATKAGILAMTKSIGVELAPFGINVNVIVPGNTETPMNEDIRMAPQFAPNRERIARITPSQRLFTPPQEIASGILFLLSDAAKGMYGSALVIDEGRSAGIP